MKEFHFNPIRRILVPTDFSPNAMGALHYAAAMATRLRSRLTLFHSSHVPIPVDAYAVAPDPYAESPGEVAKRMDALKKDLLVAYPGVDVEISISMGAAVEEILGQCQRGNTDLIVMGTKGAHGFTGMLVGSNTAEVIANAHCPVLAVPDHAGLSDIKKIVFATNYSDHDFQSIFLLTEIFKPWNPEIIVAHAGEPHRLSEENRQFEWFRGQVMTSISYDRFSFHLFEGSNTEQAISDFIRRSDADLLSVSTRRRNFIEKLLHPGMTRKLAFHMHIPLLAFHTGGPEAKSTL